MKKISLREQINYNCFESIIQEAAGDRTDIQDAALEIFNVVQEFENAELEGNLLLEAEDTLDPNLLTKLFKSASNISKGQPAPAPKQSMLSKAAGVLGKGLGKAGKVTAQGAQAVGSAIANKMADTKLGKAAAAGGKMAGRAKNALSKLNDVVNSAAKKLQSTETVQNADIKIDQLLDKWKNEIGADSKTVKLAQQVGEFGKNNPKKAAFAIALLAGLASFAGSPAAGMAVGTALRTAMGLAKGERASTAVGKAAKVAAVGTAAGAAADSLTGAGEVADTATTPEELTGSNQTPQRISDMSPEERTQWRAEKSAALGDKMADRAVESGSLKKEFADKYKELLSKGEPFSSRMGVPLTPEESAAFNKAFGKDYGIQDFSKAADWLKKNVPGADEAFPAGSNIPIPANSPTADF